MRLFSILFVLASYTIQAQPNLDSLRAVWMDDQQSDSLRGEAVMRLAQYGYLFSQPDSGFYYASEARKLAESAKEERLLAEAAKIQGISFAIRGRHGRAIEFFDEALNINERLKDSVGIAGSLNNIGLLHREMGDFPHALDYLLRSYALYESLDNLNGKALCSGNIAMIYDKLGAFEKSEEYALLSFDYFTELGQTKGIANSLHALGTVKANYGDIALKEGRRVAAERLYAEAKAYFRKSLVLREQVNDVEGISITLNGMGRVEKNLFKYAAAKPLLERSLNLARELGSPSAIESSAFDLYEIYRDEGQYKKSLEMYVLHKSMIDSILNDDNQRSVIKQEYQHTFEKKAMADSLQLFAREQELQLENERQRAQGRSRLIVLSSTGVLAILLAIGFYGRLRYARKAANILKIEKDRSESLLLNILPAEIAEELKEKGEAKARNFDLVSILFSDFIAFTETSARLSASELVEEINVCFRAFDAIMTKYNVEKIKTIGDAYMAAGGLPTPATDSVKNTVLAALEIQEFVIQHKIENNKKGKEAFEMRVGIHAGPVVAGIVGVKKFQYDIWGDTVNTASRMESNGMAGKVNLSQSIYERLCDDPIFAFESRGEIEVKGKGMIDMWFVSLQSHIG